MNVTITQNPADFQPVKTDGLFFIVSADTQSVYSFRYVYNVYIEGVKVFTGRATPNPYGLGVIDVSKILNTYANNAPIAYSADTAIFLHQTFPYSRPYQNQVLTYYIEVGEEHSLTANGRVEQYSGIGNNIGQPGVPSLDFRAYHGTYPVNYIANEQNFNIGPFVLSGTPVSNVSGLFLTNSPRQRDITYDDYYTLSFLNYRINQSVYSEPYYSFYKFYDEDGAYITGYTFDNIWSNGGGPRQSCYTTYPNLLPTDTLSSDFNILNMGVGPKNLPYIPSNTSYYTAQLFGVKSTSSVTPTPTPTLTSTPSATPTPSSSPTVCTLWEVTNNGISQQSETLTDCYGNSVNITLDPGDSTTFCAGSIPPSIFDWTFLGSCFTCGCYEVLFTNNSGRSEQLTYKTCTNTFVSLFIAAYGTLQTCVCSPSSWTGATFTASTLGGCGAITPTPTPTPSATPITGTKFATLRSCCDSSQIIDAIVSDRLNYGEVVSYNGVCWQWVSTPFTGTTDLSDSVIFSSCQDCQQSYPCGDEATIIPFKPDVEPGTVVPTLDGAGNCVTYSAVSEVFTFNLVCDESQQFGQQQVMFKNKFGSYDYFRFWRGKSEALGIERQSYQQYNQTWGQENILKTTYSRGTTNWQTTQTETHIINTGFISQAEMVYLQDLYTSDDVYEIKPDGTLFPINVTNAEFIIKNKGNKSLVNLELTYTYSNNAKLLGL